mgnify:CR=1 FL=1
MHSTLRHFGYLIILILCFYKTSFSQPPPPTLPCDDCAGSGTLSALDSVSVYVDSTTGTGCRATVQYYKRTCKGVTNIFITGYKMVGSNCGSLSDYTKIDRALALIIYDQAIPLPPYDSSGSATFWRYRRPACWQKTTSLVGLTLTYTYTSCPSAECCDTYFKATWGICGKVITYISTKDTADCPAPTPPIECFHSCGRDPIEAWR